MNKQKLPETATIVIIVICILFSAFYDGLTVKSYKLSNSKIERSFKIAVISDLHSTYFGKGQKNLIDAIDRQEPDIIVLTGDLFDSKNSDSAAKDLIANIAARYICFYVSGSHDSATLKTGEWKEFLRQNDVNVLEGQRYELSNNISICGVDDPNIGKVMFDLQLEDAFNGVDPSKFVILLSSRPELVDDYLKYPCDLIISGHTHGGFWRIPGIINGFLAPDQGWLPKYGGGYYALTSSDMIVSRGLSRQTTWLPRIYNPAELVIIEVIAH